MVPVTHHHHLGPLPHSIASAPDTSALLCHIPPSPRYLSHITVTSAPVTYHHRLSTCNTTITSEPVTHHHSFHTCHTLTSPRYCHIPPSPQEYLWYISFVPLAMTCFPCPSTYMTHLHCPHTNDPLHHWDLVA